MAYEEYAQSGFCGFHGESTLNLAGDFIEQTDGSIDFSNVTWWVNQLEYIWSSLKYVKTVLVLNQPCPGGESEDKDPDSYGYTVVGSIVAPSVTSNPLKICETSKGIIDPDAVLQSGDTLHPWTLFINDAGVRLWYPGAKLDPSYTVAPLAPPEPPSWEDPEGPPIPPEKEPPAAPPAVPPTPAKMEMAIPALPNKPIYDWDPSIQTQVVAWTNAQELEAVPVLAIKMEDDHKIRIEKPKVEPKDVEIDNWYVRIKNGKFRKRIALPYYEESEGVPQLYQHYPPDVLQVRRPLANQHVEIELEYTIPEYPNQEFYDRPALLIEKETPIILNEYTIKTRFTPIVLQSESHLSYLEVQAIRPNHSRRLRISDVDAKKGIVYLHDRIREQDEIIIRYAYQEQWYTYRGFTSYAQHYFHLDLNPSPGHRHTIAVNGFHQWIPMQPDATSYVTEERLNTELLVKSIHLYARPTSMYQVDVTTTPDPDRPGEWIYQEKKTLIYGPQPQALFHTTEDDWFDPQAMRYDPTLFRLGSIQVQANTQMNNMTILDTRTRGGGLDESLSREIIGRVNKESLYHWDIGFFDGEAYQENGVFIVRLPRTLLDTFKESEIQAAVAKHKGLGILPIIEYYTPGTVSNNLLNNAEFEYGEHPEFFDETHTTGNWSIKKMDVGTGDNYILKLIDQAQYAMTIPGYKFQGNQYDINVKTMLEPGASPRSVGILFFKYVDGTEKIQKLNSISLNQWLNYHQVIDIEKPVEYVRLLINDTSTYPTGTMLVDYIVIRPYHAFDSVQDEVHQI